VPQRIESFTGFKDLHETSYQVPLIQQIHSASSYENQSTSDKKINSKLNLFDFAEEIQRNMELDQKSFYSSVKKVSDH
jgi:hypothetical protein